jgi:hypothetical protein
MKRSNRWVGFFVATLTALTLLTFGPITHAAAGGKCPDPVPMNTPVTPHAPALQKKQTAIANSPLTLFVEAPTGGTLQLVYRPNEGWKVADAAAPKPKLAEAHLTPTAAAPPDEDSAVNQPLSVFIDGPTGYTYVWIRDKGWKFVGRITDQIQ